MSRPTCIHLFSGCGGLSLGLDRAGFSILAAIDFDEHAIKTYEEDFPQVKHALHRDLTKFSARELAKLIGTTEIDVVVGGPPCQVFSTVRRRGGANNGPRLVEDGRRHLYKQFLQYVESFRLKVFVMENVLGIKSADNGQYFTRIQREARKAGYFKRGWLAVGFLYPELHPDAPLEHGAEQSPTALPLSEARSIEARLVTPVYVQSGWPVVLRRVIREARRRYQSGELAERDFYPDAAAAAGMRHRAYGSSDAFSLQGDRAFV